MIKRKVITVILATPISLMLIFGVFFGEWKNPLELVVMSGMISFLVAIPVLGYGVPVTFLSDYVTKKLRGKLRSFTAFLIHIFFGSVFGLLFPMNSHFPVLDYNVDAAIISALIVSLFFWITDEVLRKLNTIRIGK
ncbi:hypothetical protein [Aquibacillus albus]|uniref:Permease n=1 Tax=Aquibacillus albus TaxID=1168171 RepID=A0ABS2N6A4_9BACI|nr:hypothetical protein [Aquibacillus albus]MBM7573420.1 hypothetical protein [Aquibacillus albus]